MALPEQHDRLVEAVCAANPRTVVVLSNGAPVELPWADAPAAILEAYLGGQAGGSAVGDVLFGITEPAGRLAETFPLAQTDLLADRNFPGLPRQVQYRENLYVGYRQFATTGQAVRFPFGHGLSYTRFETRGGQAFRGVLRCRRRRRDPLGCGHRSRIPATAPVRQWCRCTCGSLAAACIVPRANCVGSRRCASSRARERRARIDLDAAAFRVWDVGAHGWRVSAGDYEVLVGFSAEDIWEVLPLEVRSADLVTPVARPRELIANEEEFALLLGRPIPPVEPLHPFTRTSTVADIGVTALGRQVQKQMRKNVAARFGSDGTIDPAMQRLLDHVIPQMPLRNLVMAADGRLPWKALDALIAALNGRWVGAVRKLLAKD